MTIITGDQERLIADIEDVMHQEIGRNLTRVYTVSKGSLGDASASITQAERPGVGIVTGFFIPAGDPPFTEASLKGGAAETDGPLGAAMLFAALHIVGIACRLVTDAPCADVCCAALNAIVPDPEFVNSHFDSVTPDTIEETIRLWDQENITHAVSIERCGPNAEGKPCNMRGHDISAYTAPLERIYASRKYQIAVGDGGNEIGMGIPKYNEHVVQDVNFGDRIACVVPATHGIAAGVSNWGAYGMIAAMAVLRPDWGEKLMGILTVENNEKILKAMVDAGAVDGVKRERLMSVDGMALSVHNSIVEKMRNLVFGGRRK